MLQLLRLVRPKQENSQHKSGGLLLQHRKNRIIQFFSDPLSGTGKSACSWNIHLRVAKQMNQQRIQFFCCSLTRTSHVTNVPTLFETYNSSCTLQQSTQLGVMACDGSFSFVNNSQAGAKPAILHLFLKYRPSRCQANEPAKNPKFLLLLNSHFSRHKRS